MVNNVNKKKTETQFRQIKKNQVLLIDIKSRFIF